MFWSLCYVAGALLVVFVSILCKNIRDVRTKLKWIRAVPRLPIVGNALGLRDSTKSLHALAQMVSKYNGLCYIEILYRPMVLITDHKFLEFLLSSNTILRKSRDYQFLCDWLQEGILITHGPRWKKSRKILTPSFHFTILEEFVDVFEGPIATLLKLFEIEVGKNSVDIYPYIANFGLDLICETTMGAQTNAQENPHSDYVFAVNEMCRIVVERAFIPGKMYDSVYKFTKDYYKQKKYVQQLHSASNSVIEKRKKELECEREEEKSEDGRKRKLAFLDLLLKYRDENGEPLSDEFIRQEVDTFMFAGHDTTASAISFCLYCLANHPEVQESAVKEIKEILSNNQKVTYRDLQNMKYLELVIKEVLRLYPSVPFYSRETEEEIIYDGDKIIPKDVTLVIVAYEIHRNPKVYNDPEKFDPNRFANIETKLPYSYLPFSAGPRNCIGQKFAMLEMKSTLAKILLNYELFPATPKHELILAAETVLKSKNGIRIRIEKRH